MKEDRKYLLGHERIGKLLLILSAPAMVGMIVQALYNIVDTVFVGRGVGSEGIAGLSIVFPIHMIMLGAGTVIGIGGASLISRSLGAGNHEKADHALGNVVFMITVSGLAITCLGLVFQEPLLRLFGASEAIMPYSRDYLEVLLKGMFFFIFLIAGNNIIRSEGNAMFAMVSMFISAGVNIVLDPIFIFGLKMGVRGAAIATVIAWVCACIFQVIYFSSKKSMLKPRARHFRPDRKIAGEILAVGSSSFVRSSAASVTIILINRGLGTYGGDIAIAVFGVVHKVMMFIFMPIFGICQGLQPIVGFNYGAEKPERVRKAVLMALGVTTGMASAGYLAVMLFPAAILSVFSTEVPLLIMGKRALRIVALVLPVVSTQVVGTVMFQALGRARPAFLLSLARQVFFVIPLVLILPPYMGVNGIFASFPVADFMAFLLTLSLLVREMRKMKKAPAGASPS